MRFCCSEVSLYLLVGAIVAATYFCLIFLFVDVLEVQYLIGVTAAYVIAVSLHFILNRRVTFRATEGHLGRQGLRYVSLLVINYLITVIVLYLSVGVAGVSAYSGAAIAIGATILSGYVISRLWVFK